MSGAGADLPRLVIFDVDGTLQDTFAWWKELVPVGIAKFAREQGLELPVPDAATAFSVIGKSDADVWSALLPPEYRGLWPELAAVFVPLEVAELRSGADYLFPGTRELLAGLRADGLRIALASNCRSPYLEAVLDGQGVGPLVDEAWCLDSPGVATKSDMVRLALESAGTRDAVLVGDRESDREAAAAHGVPFVLRTGYHEAGELEAAATAGSQAEVRAAIVAARR